MKQDVAEGQHDCPGKVLITQPKRTCSITVERDTLPARQITETLEESGEEVNWLLPALSRQSRSNSALI